MPARPSDPLLEMLRGVAKKKKLNTAALARACNVPRARMKHILSGSEPMLVDELIKLSSVLELDPTGMAGAEDDTEEEDTDGEAGPTLASVGRKQPAPSTGIDPLGNHAEQILHVGFELGVDMFIVLDATVLQGTGVPRSVLARHKEHLPLQLDAAYHRHHDPRFLPDGLSIKLSFDALYDCHLPWAAFVEVRLRPLPPDPVEPEPEPEDDEPKAVFGHLRLV